MDAEARQCHHKQVRFPDPLVLMPTSDDLFFVRVWRTILGFVEMYLTGRLSVSEVPDKPGVASGQSSALTEASNNSNSLNQQSRYSEAEPYAEEALRLGMEEFGPDHPATIVPQTLEEALAAYEQGDYVSTIRVFEVLAEEGNAEAQYKLSVMYSDGEGVQEDDTEAEKWARKAAEQGLAKAQFMLGEMTDEEKWIRKAAEQGLAEAQYMLGVSYWYRDDYADAVFWYRKAAEQGFAEGQYALGDMYRDGNGVDQDHEESIKWLKRAAEQGDDFAQLELGDIYATGQVVAQNYVEALKWYRKLADQDDRNAQFIVGNMYAEGQGVAQDNTEAAYWYLKAAEWEHLEAQRSLSDMYFKGQGVPRNYDKAAHWKRRSEMPRFDKI